MGSSKILSLGRLAGLSEQETLCLFGQFYKDVVANPSGTDHPNIRNFMKGAAAAYTSALPFYNQPSRTPLVFCPDAAQLRLRRLLCLYVDRGLGCCRVQVGPKHFCAGRSWKTVLHF